MKKSILALLLLLAAASIGFAQSIKISPRKVVYIRKGRQIPKEKKTFVVTFPVVSGSIPLETKKNLENSISYWHVFKTSLRENQGEYDWLSELSYQVNYNKNGILDIALTQEGVGAYPDQSTVDLIIDLKTGRQIRFSDAFKVNSLAKFAQMVNVKLEAEKRKIIRSIDKDKAIDSSQQENDSIKEQISSLTFATKSFEEYSVNDKGVTIIYDAGFPHVIQALQPDGRYFFTWAQLKPFVKYDGLLGKFIR